MSSDSDTQNETDWHIPKLIDNKMTDIQHDQNLMFVYAKDIGESVRKS
jgi:hypothetical protein